MSWRELAKQGCKMFASDDTMTIFDKYGKLWQTAKLQNDNLFHLEEMEDQEKDAWPPTDSECLQATSIDLEHLKFCHINERYLKIINPKLKGQKMKPCQNCALSKSTKAPIKETKTPENQPQAPLDILCRDLKQIKRGKGGKKWLGTIIDQKSRLALTVFLSTKDQFYEEYRKALIYIKNQTGRLPKWWTADGGGEFDNDQMKKLNEEMGIHFQFTTENTPNKNGIPERFNRTSAEAIRAMLLGAGLKHYHWVAAARYFVYVKNRTPHSFLKFKTPFEVFYGRKPHLLPLRVFGCLAMVHISNNNRPKSQLEM